MALTDQIPAAAEHMAAQEPLSLLMGEGFWTISPSDSIRHHPRPER